LWSLGSATSGPDSSVENLTFSSLVFFVLAIGAMHDDDENSEEWVKKWGERALSTLTNIPGRSGAKNVVGRRTIKIICPSFLATNIPVFIQPTLKLKHNPKDFLKHWCIPANPGIMRPSFHKTSISEIHGRTPTTCIRRSNRTGKAVQSPKNC
jgi:hypothetical protein